jgi:AcrR family transcriptional regulator
MSAEQTRDRILDAALKLFSQKGYLGAPTREIAREARVAEVTLFRHFPTKEALFKEVIRRYSFLPALRSILPGLEDAGYEEALLAIARGFLATLDERRDLIRIMLAERHLYPSQVKGIFRGFLGEMVRMLSDYFRQLQARGVLRDFDPDAAAKAFLGAFFAYVHFLGFFFETAENRRHNDRFAVEFVSLFIQGTVRHGAAAGSGGKPGRGDGGSRKGGAARRTGRAGLTG